MSRDRLFTAQEVVDLIYKIRGVDDQKTLRKHDKDLNEITILRLDERRRDLTPEERAEVQRIGNLFLAHLTTLTVAFNSEVLNYTQ